LRTRRSAVGVGASRREDRRRRPRPDHGERELVDDSERVRAGDVVRAFDGADIVEGTIVETTTVEPPERTIGRGLVARVINEGARVSQSSRLVRFRASGGDRDRDSGSAPHRPATPLPGAKVVALTFDDGPWPGQTDALLDILANETSPRRSSCWLAGQGGSDVARRVYEAAICSATTRSGTGASTRFRRMRCAARSGARTPRSRRRRESCLDGSGHPAGNDRAAYAEIRRLGMSTALWTVDPADWRDDVAATPSSTTSSGREARCSDLASRRRWRAAADARCSTLIIDGLRARGYEFVTLDELPSVRSRW